MDQIVRSRDDLHLLSDVRDIYARISGSNRLDR
jgi:hypothetical protein